MYDTCSTKALCGENKLFLLTLVFYSFPTMMLLKRVNLKNIIKHNISTKCQG